MIEKKQIKQQIIIYIFLFIGVFLFILYKIGAEIKFNYQIQIIEQEEVLYQVIGEEKMGEATVYAVSQLLKGIKKEEQIEIGRKIMDSYGYREPFYGIFESRSKKMQQYLYLYGVFLLCIIMLGLGGLIFLLRKKQKLELREMEHVLERFQTGKYNIILPFYEEGIYSQINYKFGILEKILIEKEEKLQKEKEETKSLVTNISHQLKTPLAALDTCFSLLLEEELSQKEQKEFMERSKEQIIHLEKLVDALVNISRLETGLIEIKKELSDVFKTILQAVNMVYVKAATKQITIELEDTLSIKVAHDIKWTAEAFVNILDNAIKYSPIGSKIYIRMQKRKSYLRIEIEDEGIGVKKEEYNQIFKRFYRGNHAAIKKQEGSGVGLYLTRLILEEQYGTISVHSKLESQGKGSIFIVQLFL